MIEHPAKFSAPVMHKIMQVLEAERPEGRLRIVDPFAGVGGVHELQLMGHTTKGYEIESEWASEHPHTICANIMSAKHPKRRFDCMVTSPCYGNRNADDHEAKDLSKRYSYKHVLGHDPELGSSAVLQWGDSYRSFHRAWLSLMLDEWLVPGALVVINISNHIRNGREQMVAEWFVAQLYLRDCKMLQVFPVPTRRMRNGANRNARVDREFVLVFESPQKAG